MNEFVVPKHVWIGPYKYKIKLVHDLRGDDGTLLYGVTKPLEHTIYLRADNSPVQMRATLLHEIMHCILNITFFDIESELEERIVRALDDLLLDAITRTPSIGKFLIGV